ncbi:hypothetical protein ABCR94_16515 [Streptomyces sp. 21So2-11]|uniref:hypothetical protein n=1 Tax=Streptomyces sp. 21So2-11 TaxID=3144408 RepID=UPI003219E166
MTDRTPQRTLSLDGLKNAPTALAACWIEEDAMAWSADGATSGGTARRHRSAASYRHDPLAFLAAEFDDTRDIWHSASGRLCVADPVAAREVMGNRRGAFVETSDFFHVHSGVFGPRSAQIEIGRAARSLIRHRLDAHRADLPRLVAERLVPTSTWPDAGNLLVREHLRDVLLRSRSSIDHVAWRSI